MAHALKTWLMTPMVWLVAAGLLFSAAIALGYHQDQQIAVERMLKTSGPAPLVAVQNFDATAHTNLSGEVRVIAEVNFADIYEIEVGSAGLRQAAVLIPLYPVSETGFRIVRAEVEGKTSPRPVVRSDVSRDRAVPVGAILSRSPHAVSNVHHLDHLVTRRIGPGTFGSIVEVTGMEVPGFTEDATIVPMRGPFPIELSASPVIVEPISFVPPVLSQGTPQHSNERRILVQSGVVFLLFAALFAVRPAPSSLSRKIAPRPRKEQNQAKPSNKTFQPIRTQDEILDAEYREAAEEARRRRDAGLLALVPFKSRR